MDPVAKGFEADLTKGGYRIAEGPLCVNGLLGFVAYDPKHPACAMRVAENTSQDAWEVYVDERYINRGNTAKPPASQVTALADDARLPHCIVHHPPFPFAEGAPSEVGIAKPRMLTSTIGGMAVTMTPSALSAPGNLPA